jgi:hypothetical protein
MLPFTHQQFVLVFSLYNGAIWPLQPIVHGAGLAMLVLLLRPSRARVVASVALIALLWLWTGVIYQIGFFSRINPVALAFGAMFVVEGALLLEAACRGRLAFARAGTGTGGVRRAFGWTLLVYSVAVYPLLGALLGAGYFESPPFGLTPCPLTLTTLGMLLVASPPVPHRLYVVPMAWAGHRRQRGRAAANAARLGAARDADRARPSRRVRAFQAREPAATGNEGRRLSRPARTPGSGPHRCAECRDARRPTRSARLLVPGAAPARAGDLLAREERAAAESVGRLALEQLAVRAFLVRRVLGVLLGIDLGRVVLVAERHRLRVRLAQLRAGALRARLEAGDRGADGDDLDDEVSAA